MGKSFYKQVRGYKAIENTPEAIGYQTNPSLIHYNILICIKGR